MAQHYQLIIGFQLHLHHFSCRFVKLLAFVCTAPLYVCMVDLVW